MQSRAALQNSTGSSASSKAIFFAASSPSTPKQIGPALGLLSRMVTTGGTRNIVSRDDLIARVAAEDGFDEVTLTRTLTALERKAGLINREQRRGIYFYEIASEFLVELIKDKSENLFLGAGEAAVWLFRGCRDRRSLSSLRGPCAVGRGIARRLRRPSTSPLYWSPGFTSSCFAAKRFSMREARTGRPQCLSSRPRRLDQDERWRHGRDRQSYRRQILRG